MGMIGIGSFFFDLGVALTAILGCDQGGYGCSIVFKSIYITWIGFVSIQATDVMFTMSRIFPLQIKCRVALFMA